VRSNWRDWILDEVMTELILGTIPESYIPEEDLDSGVVINVRSLAALHEKRSAELLSDLENEKGEEVKVETVEKDGGVKTNEGGGGGNKSTSSVYPL
jgi:uncharacterized GH25 family protein